MPGLWYGAMLPVLSTGIEVDMGKLEGADFRDKDYDAYDNPGKSALIEFLSQREIWAKKLREVGLGDVQVYLGPRHPEGKWVTGDVEIRDEKRSDNPWVMHNGHPCFKHNTVSIFDRRKDSPALFQFSFSLDGLNAYTVLTEDVPKGKYFLADFSYRKEDASRHISFRLALMFHRGSRQDLWKLCDGTCWGTFLCEDDIDPTPHQIRLLNILKFEWIRP